MSDDNEHALLTDDVQARRSHPPASELHQSWMVIGMTTQAHFAAFARWMHLNWLVWPWNPRFPVHGSCHATHQHSLCLAVMSGGRMSTAG